jgi:hypothetical protein
MGALSRTEDAPSHHPPALSRETSLESLDRDARSFVDLLRHADHATLVPDCPGWSLAGLQRLTVTGDVDAIRRTIGLALTP